MPESRESEDTMTKLGKLPTQYAPAERLPRAELDQGITRFFDIDYLQEFLDNVPDVVMVLNDYRQAIFANASTLDIFEIKDISGLYGLRPGEALKCVHAFESEGGCGTTEFCRTCGAINAILDSQKGRYSVRECRITRSRGDSLDLRVYASPFDVDGTRYTVFTVDDISHEKRRLALERIFFHDIANTISSLNGFAQLFNEARPEDDAEVRESILTLSAHLVDELNAQRDLIAAENHELTPHPAAASAVGLLREVLVIYRQRQGDARRHIEIEESCPDLEIVTDVVLLKRVLGNMLKNAIEASSVGETITLGCDREGDAVLFRVTNPAVMSPDVQHQVFQRSFSTKGDNRGLGTYSMRLLTEHYLKGSVSFTSDKAQGTIFRARLPLDMTLTP
jgi:PAS domain-containing protein